MLNHSFIEYHSEVDSDGICKKKKTHGYIATGVSSNITAMKNSEFVQLHLYWSAYQF